MSSDIRINSVRTFRPEWNDGKLNEVVRSLTKGRTLNFPCGESGLGHLRADIDDTVNPDILASLEDPPFSRGEFDTVYCDPPYSMYHGDQSWIKGVAEIAKKRLILQTPSVRILPLTGVDKQYVLVEPGPGSHVRYVRTLQVFDFPDWFTSLVEEGGSE